MDGLVKWVEGILFKILFLLGIFELTPISKSWIKVLSKPIYFNCFNSSVGLLGIFLYYENGVNSSVYIATLAY